MKKFIPTIILFAAVLLGNILSVMIFKEYALINAHSFFPVFFCGVLLIYGIFGCLLKHRGNAFLANSPRPLNPDYDVDKFYEFTYTPEYEKEFIVSRFLYFVVLPFYIPLVFFAKSSSSIAWSFVIWLIPQAVFITYRIVASVREEKEMDEYYKKLEKERKEQEWRESMGIWKKK